MKGFAVCAANLHCCSADGQGLGLSSDENQPPTSMFVSSIIPFCILPVFYSLVLAHTHSQLQLLHRMGVVASEIRRPSTQAYDAV